MIRFLTGAVLPAMLLAACASAPRQAAEPGGTAAPASVAVTHAGPAATADLPAPEAAPAVAAPAHSDPAVATNATADATAASGAAPDAEADFAALYRAPADITVDGNGGNARPAYDPWEPMNRRVHAFNNAVDRTIARPLATAYVAVVPQPLRLGVTNFFDNLGSPVTFVNQLLQGRPRDAAQTLGRFLVNSTLGIGGLFDPASDLKMKRRREDFGQTLGTWGWRQSRYVEVPFFGPRTVRDVLGRGADAPLSPVRQIDEDAVRIGLQGLQQVDTRVRLLSLDALRDAAPDEYAMTRDAWLQRRNYMIDSDRRHHDADEFPEYLIDPAHDPTVPAGAM